MTDTYTPPTPPETPPPLPEPVPAAGKPSLIDRTWKTWSRKKKIGVSVLAGIVGFTALGAVAPKEPEKDNTHAAAAPTTVVAAPAPEKTVTETVKAEEPSAAPAPTTAPTMSPEETTDAVFMVFLSTKGIDVGDREHTIALGHAVCVKFDQGASLLSVGGELMDTYGLTVTQTGSFVGAAVNSYCPEHKSVFDQ